MSPPPAEIGIGILSVQQEEGARGAAPISGRSPPAGAGPRRRLVEVRDELALIRHREHTPASEAMTRGDTKPI